MNVRDLEFLESMEKANVSLKEIIRIFKQVNDYIKSPQNIPPLQESKEFSNLLPYIQTGKEE